ncbi:MAG: HAD family hydrolase [Clostridia bacterium]|nr:HAD family hydrolase [Clostridia bacterium]
MSKCVIFDLDGTILDTIETITYYVNLTFKEVGLEPILVEDCKYYAGNGARKLIERALASRGITDEDSISRILEIYKKLYDDAPLYLTKPFDGIAEMLEKLRRDGYKLAVVSNKPNTASYPIVKHFFGDAFDVISGALDGVPVKPDPTLPLYVLDKLSLKPDDSIFVGDTYVDMETGRNLHSSKVIGVLWGFRKKEELDGAGADITVHTADELYKAITE